jgi:hypothetical protein
MLQDHLLYNAYFWLAALSPSQYAKPNKDGITANSHRQPE